MSKNLQVLFLFFASTLVGCSGLSVNPASLRAASTKTSIVLDQQFAYDRDASLSGNKFQYTLSAGKYFPLGQDENGTYFQGPAHCFKVESLTPSAKAVREGYAGETYPCGIFLPKTSGAAPLIYFFPFAVAFPQAASIRASTPQTDVALRTQLAGSFQAGASPVQAGVGAAVGGAIVDAIIQSEIGNLGFFDHQPPADRLRAAINFKD